MRDFSSSATEILEIPQRTFVKI